MYKQFTVNNVKVNIATDDISKLRLLQPDTSKVNLDMFRYTDKLLFPSAIINGSYGDDSYGFALGRSQGDVYNNTSSFNEQKYLGFGITENGYKSGELEFWDIPNTICGFTPALICIQNGQDVKLCSTGLNITYDYKLNLATAITFMGILEDKKTVQLITAQKGLSGGSLLKWLKDNFKYDFLCELDGGGSSQMIVDKQWVQKSTDFGGKRKVYSALAFIDTEPSIDELKERIKALETTLQANNEIVEKFIEEWKRQKPFLNCESKKENKMKLFRKKNSDQLIRIIATGNKYSGRTFYVLHAPAVADITEENLIACFGTEDYADTILGGSAIYTDDLSVKIWNEAEEIFK